jgi:hypothetical protein
VRDDAFQEGEPTHARSCRRCGAALPAAGALSCPGCQLALPAQPWPASAPQVAPEPQPSLWDRMGMFNAAGLVMMVACMWPFAGLALLLGDTLDEPRSPLPGLLGGPVLVAVDWYYRRKSLTGHWLIPDRGGMILWLPAWVMGFVWIGLGVWRLVG